MTGDYRAAKISLETHSTYLVMYPLVGPEPLGCGVWKYQTVADLNEFFLGYVQRDASAAIHQFLFLL